MPTPTEGCPGPLGAHAQTLLSALPELKAELATHSPPHYHPTSGGDGAGVPRAGTALPSPVLPGAASILLGAKAHAGASCRGGIQAQAPVVVLHQAEGLCLIDGLGGANL